MGKVEVVLHFNLIFLNLQTGIKERQKKKNFGHNVRSLIASGIFPVQKSRADQTSAWHSHHHNVLQLLYTVVLDSFLINMRS